MLSRRMSGNLLSFVFHATYFSSIVVNACTNISKQDARHVKEFSICQNDSIESLHCPHRRNRFNGQAFRIDLSDSIDELFVLVSTFVAENSLTLPDIQHSFWLSFLPLPRLYGALGYSFSSGSLHYLNKLEHNGTVVIATYKDGTFTIDLNVIFDHVLLSYDYLVQMLLLKERGKIYIEATWISASVRIDIDTSSCKLHLNKLQLNSMESIKVFIYRNGLVDQWMTPLFNIAVFLVRIGLTKQMEQQLTTVVGEYFEWINRKYLGRIFSSYL